MYGSFDQGAKLCRLEPSGKKPSKKDYFVK
jgi:hypothetical protein